MYLKSLLGVGVFWGGGGGGVGRICVCACVRACGYKGNVPTVLLYACLLDRTLVHRYVVMLFRFMMFWCSYIQGYTGEFK